MQGRLGKKKTLPVMLGSIEALDQFNHLKFIQAEEPNYKASQKCEECWSSVKLIQDMKEMNYERVSS